MRWAQLLQRRWEVLAAPDFCTVEVATRPSCRNVRGR